MTTKTKTEVVSPNGVDTAQQQVDRLNQERKTANDMLAQLQDELATLEGSMGDELLTAKLADPTDSKTADAIALRVSTTRAAVVSAEAMCAAIGPRIQEAEKAVYGAQAAELRDQVKELFAPLEKRIKKVAAMLDALEEFEGVKWMPFPWPHGGVGLVNSWARTKTGEDIAAIAELEASAARLEAHAGVGSPDSILTGVPLVPLLIGCPGQNVGPMPERVEQDFEKRARLLDNKPGLLGYRS